MPWASGSPEGQSSPSFKGGHLLPWGIGAALASPQPLAGAGRDGEDVLGNAAFALWQHQEHLQDMAPFGSLQRARDPSVRNQEVVLDKKVVLDGPSLDHTSRV